MFIKKRDEFIHPFFLALNCFKYLLTDNSQIIYLSPMAPSSLSFTFESDFAELDRLPEVINAIINHFTVNEDFEAILMLAVSEGVTNAIKHGNKFDRNKKAYMHCEITENRTLIIKIEDEGSGFNPDTIPDPLAEENLLKPSGRGVYLMNQAANVSYNDKGNILILTLDISKSPL
ncbi:MAG: ATP-binding protein [Candidatus Cyclonatronum sp.]|uniref:ATP-binding protein n=1 Tax=Cyclonatronum sp. TaxID=3024185 RepID=UPI0025BB102D|nr:ATP-binding protein [Cyclonatronum sp.]MCH8485779.1 ATP-binding protein [Cyclonatronum sp.]